MTADAALELGVEVAEDRKSFTGLGPAEPSAFLLPEKVDAAVFVVGMVLAVDVVDVGPGERLPMGVAGSGREAPRTAASAPKRTLDGPGSLSVFLN